MRYKTLGKSGLRVSELCLGTMTFGEDWGWGASEAESRRLFDTFAEAGGNFVDTANSYTGGTSESLIGQFVQGRRDQFVLATKYTHLHRNHDPNASGNHRKNLVQSVEGSLQRLQTDYLDVLWLHAWDFLTPVEEVMRALDDLVRAGKVLYIGISDTPAWVVSQANTYALLQGWTPFIGLQVEYSLIQRTAERDLLPMAHALDVGVLAWGPLGAGLLTGKYAGTVPREAATHRIEAASAFYGGLLTPRNHAIAAAVQAIAAETGHAPSAIALAWLRQQPGGIVPIIGARTAAQLTENLTCLTVQLSGDQMAQLDTASRIELGFPHDFLAAGPVQYLVYGDHHAAIVRG